MTKQNINFFKRPFLYKILFISLILISLNGWLRLYQSIYQWDWLVRYQVTPGPLYSAILGTIIGFAGISAAVLFWTDPKTSKNLTQIIICAILLIWWMDYLVFNRTTLAYADLHFRVVISIGYLIFVFMYFKFSKFINRQGKRDEYKSKGRGN